MCQEPQGTEKEQKHPLCFQGTRTAHWILVTGEQGNAPLIKKSRASLLLFFKSRLPAARRAEQGWSDYWTSTWTPVTTDPRQARSTWALHRLRGGRVGTQVCPSCATTELLLTTLWLRQGRSVPRSPCDGSLVPSMVGPEGRWSGPGGVCPQRNRWGSQGLWLFLSGGLL